MTSCFPPGYIALQLYDLAFIVELTRTAQAIGHEQIDVPN